MAIARHAMLEILRDSYSAYYTLCEDVQTELPLAFRADYRARDERYWLTKSVPIWGNEKNEYAYIFSAPRLEPELLRRCIDFAWADMLPRVQPHKEHQCTNAKVIFVADALDEDSVKSLQKDNRTRSYRLGLHGYSNLLTAAVDLTEQKTYTNKAGHELAAYFRKLFAAREGGT